MTLLATLLLGFFLGVRHATDPDHVVAVSTIVGREPSRRGALWIGAAWGVGHTATILAVGGAIVIFNLVIPARLGLSMELTVAVMLVVLGLLNLRSAVQRLDEVTGHADHPPPLSGSRYLRPLVVGVLHGLAGSAAIALLVLGTVRQPLWGFLYLALFGVGTVVGMMFLTTAMSVPLAHASRRFASFDRLLARTTGLLSLAFGLYLVYRVGFVDGLFTSRPAWTPQ
jgi:ABC-type nickel/cobalt efflux system permease component RcnA